jgi:flagellar biosynthesis/type III secretory pathway M-ring protein FliF/YscJ
VVLDHSGIKGDYAENVRSIVSNAIGVEPERITVEALPFRDMEQDPAVEVAAKRDQALQSIQQASTIRLVIICAVILFVLLILLAAVKTLRPKPAVSEVMADLYGPAIMEEGVDVMADEQITVPVQEEEQEEITFDTKNKDTKVRQLENYIDTRPEEVVQLLKGWITDSAED